jgi:(1->4)-alpha-D-glucan 1-alpha-D-glucosylmutase
VVEHGLHAEVHRLVEVAAAVCHDHLELRDHTRRALREALVEILAAFPVYRAYVVPGEPAPEAARATVHAAVETALGRLPDERHDTARLLGRLALGEHGRGRHRDEFVVRFQQTCGPVMAKGVEDTAFYRWLRFSALNEVGGDPARLGVPPESFHAWCGRQQARWAGSMTTLSTHDTKRSEDVRARLFVLTEGVPEWAVEVTQWRAASASYRPAALDANTEYLFWQTLVGAWPLDAERLKAYLEKATREAKRHTTWTEPDERYDESVRVFVDRVLADGAVLAQVAAYVERLAPAFRANVLGQKLTQLTVPGVPDVYQGCELVDLSLVDPDNRRPVDYPDRRARLARLDEGGAPADLDDEKLLVVSRALRLRRDNPAAFGPEGSYRPVRTDSPHAVAFCRGGDVVTLVTRLSRGLECHGGWGDATVALPEGTWTDVLTGAGHPGGARPLRDVLARLPVALLVRSPGP